MKLLIDERLSPKLTKLAHAKGHAVTLPPAGRRDAALTAHTIEHDPDLLFR